MINTMTSPCNFDHNGECLVCDCWPSDCAYQRLLKQDYSWETKEQLEAMFKKYIQNQPDMDSKLYILPDYQLKELQRTLRQETTVKTIIVNLETGNIVIGLNSGESILIGRRETKKIPFGGTD
jgi:hypothetical protein